SFFFSSRRRHTRSKRDWSSDVCSSDLPSFDAQLFVGDKQISVRDARLESALEIPVVEITSAQAEESHGRWFLRVNWAGKTAVFRSEERRVGKEWRSGWSRGVEREKSMV